MAEDKLSKETKTAKKAKAPGGNKVVKFFKDYKSELNKIVWPTKEETLKKSSVVAVSLIISGAVIGLIDFGFIQLILLLGSIF
ncbi:MAG: preprotein translocase subunit SecE [Eubacteriales bacterium]|nr:preprotein translocase subunit SecE [Eubacteriales bacterium]MDD4474599.1 preprotein translocase subunit SecE [Eubacteriales bacterium]